MKAGDSEVLHEQHLCVESKTKQTVTVGSCLDGSAVGTCFGGLFVCCDGL